MAPNPHPTGVVPFLKGSHFDQAGHVTGRMVLRDEVVPIDCYSVRDRSWGPRPQGRPKRRSEEPRVTGGHLRWRWLLFLRGWTRRGLARLHRPGPEVEPVSCGFLLRAARTATSSPASGA